MTVDQDNRISAIVLTRYWQRTMVGPKNFKFVRELVADIGMDPLYAELICHLSRNLGKKIFVNCVSEKVRVISTELLKKIEKKDTAQRRLKEKKINSLMSWVHEIQRKKVKSQSSETQSDFSTCSFDSSFGYLPFNC